MNTATATKCRSFMPDAAGDETVILCDLARGHDGDHVSRSQRYRWATPDASDDAPPAETQPEKRRLRPSKPTELGHITTADGFTIYLARYGKGATSEEWQALIDLIICSVNSHAALVAALKLFKAMNNCNYELETMRRSGLFEQIDEALRLAGALDTDQISVGAVLRTAGKEV